MGRSERVSNQTPQTPETFAAHWPGADLLTGFRVEWDDGSVGIAEAMAIFVRTAGFGTGHQKLELLTVDDLVAILPGQRLILARTRDATGHALGKALAHRLRRGLVRLVTPTRRYRDGSAR
jgi:hypothetical protein